MYLKYLAVEGFKSFPEWNGLELAPGTCILVGANGTGKSNLTEAVCWVLGQSDTSSLRVRGPADLIFAGTDELWPMDAGEVTVVLDPRPERIKGEGLPAGACKHGNAASHSGDLPDGALTISRRVTAGGGDMFLLDGVETDPEHVRAMLLESGVGCSPGHRDPAGRTRATTPPRAAGATPGDRRGSGHPPSLPSPRRARRRSGTRSVCGESILRASATTSESRQNAFRGGRHAGRGAGARIQGRRPSGGRGARRPRLHPGTRRRRGALLDILGLPAREPGTEPPSEPKAAIAEHQERLAALGPVNRRAETDLRAVRDRLAALEQLLAGVDQDLDHLATSIGVLEAEIASEFSAALARVEHRFRSYYALLAPGGEAGLAPDFRRRTSRALTWWSDRRAKCSTE